MAFDHSDTDRIYDQHIEPVLKRNNIIPIIINRREDNRDINNQIIGQLDNCDFCIADLSYTRPSVYYEAGYAQSQVEVIYTVRTDHLGIGQPEDRRVHFDLQMKPIIKWDNPSDKTFQSRLEKRLRNTVLKTWQQQYEKSLKTSAEQDKFNSFPLANRLKIYRKNAINIAVRYNFKNWVLKKNPSFHYGDHDFYKKVYKNPSRYSNYNVFFFGEKKSDNNLKLITITSIEKVLTDFFRYRARILLGRSSFDYYLLAKNEKDIKSLNKIEEHHLILSPNKIPESRIRSEMPNLYKDKESDRYYFDTSYNFGKEKKEFAINRRVFLYFPTGIDSESNVKRKLDNIIRKI
jgi:nucleoside 2-deoxyribosyltransferase